MAQASAEKLEHTGPAEKERVASVPQREQLAKTPEQREEGTKEKEKEKEMEQSRQSRVPDREGVETQGE